MFRKHIIRMIIAAAAVGAFTVVPAMAQDDPTNPIPAPVVPGTITVTGIGEASGAPDIANLTLGVQVVDTDIKVAFAGANSQIEQVIDAIVNAGVAETDIRTSGLNIYQEQQPMGPDFNQGQSRYYVSNQVLVTVRDISKVADVINAAVEAGANNLYGLDFSINDHASLEKTARQDAFADAQARAAELAALAGVTLAEVQSITEVANAGFYPPLAREQAMGGGGSAIQPGQLSVNVQLQVTFGISR